MRYLLRLDLERIRLNLEAAAPASQADDDVMRLLASRGVWRSSDEWWGARAEALTQFAEGEILERRAAD